MVSPPLHARVRAFIQADVDAQDQQELEDLLQQAGSGDADAEKALKDRFCGPLQFGTAGLRGLMGAGESRMNRANVLRTTAGTVRYLLQVRPQAKSQGIVIGRDARHRSKNFQRDAAEVALALGVKVYFLDTPCPTPLVAFAVRHLGADLGIMITASHNPPEYNGYKVYWNNGAQIIPPIDRAIADTIDRMPPAAAIERRPLEEGRACGLLCTLPKIEEAYVDTLMSQLIFDATSPVEQVSMAYSPLHGVGAHLFQRAMTARGVKTLHTVATQAEPDGNFPTVRFPNPEEPEAVEQVLRLAEKTGSDLVLVNDPDADRLGVAFRVKNSTEYRVLNGNEIGVLLADHIIRNTEGKDRLLITTIVSSRLLQALAREAGVRYQETLTGFKWIANEALRLEREEHLRFMVGYEEALGYTVGSAVKDKDGIGPALVVVELVATLKAKEQDLADRLLAIRQRLGHFFSRQKSIVLSGSEGQEAMAQAMAKLRKSAPDLLSVLGALSYWDLAKGFRRDAAGHETPVPDFSTDALVFDLADGGRIAVRPSGTEPKIKFYLEIVRRPAPDEAPNRISAQAQEALVALEQVLLEASGLPSILPPPADS